jgi:MinD superfamily P-loop ATPase
MKQLVILSGKGGTGKTSVAAAFAHLASVESAMQQAVLADADVDAANLELVLSPHVIQANDFVGGAIAVVDPDQCERCGACAPVCRFDAISEREGMVQVDEIACDGCAACVYQCPTRAIRMEPQVAGRWFRSETRYGPLFHAALRPAQENSGKLVTLVKQQARLLALDEHYPLVIVDGPPGIGCPVISAASGADLALVVTEPTVAGIHDLERTLNTTAHFRVPSVVCVNKADICSDGRQQIEAFCHARGIPIVGQIPFDSTVTRAMVQGEPVTVVHPEAPASAALRATWQAVAERLSEQENRP